MKSRCIVPTILGAVAFLAASSALVCAADTDISWIGRLPGMKAGVQSKEGDEIKIIYNLKADPDKTMARVLAGLEERGWDVERGGGSLLAGTALQSLQGVKARKGPALLKILVASTPGQQSLILKLYGGTTAPPVASSDGASIDVRGDAHGGGRVVVRDSDGTVTADSSGRVAVTEDHSGDSVRVDGGKVVIKEGGRHGETVTITPGVSVRAGSGRQIVINQNGVERTIRCEGGTSIVVNGNEADLLLKGECAALVVNGNENRVKALGRIDSITVNGNENKVGWDAAANPSKPSISNLGSENRVYRLTD
jgi:hypothetical protein